MTPPICQILKYAMLGAARDNSVSCKSNTFNTQCPTEGKELPGENKKPSCR